MWSLDALFRSRLAGTYSAFLIVFVTQIICAIVVLPLCWTQRREILLLKARDWVAFIFLAGASNILAMAAFTYAFARAESYSTPILIQKVQPIFSILSAALFLREEIPRRYLVLSLFAMAGSLLVGYGGGASLVIDSKENVTVIFSLLAALLWGVGTTAGRFVSLRSSFLLVTALRYAVSVLIMLLLTPFWWAEMVSVREPLSRDLPLFVGMALVPGLLALAVYYRGMQVTRASVACWLELAYPVSAIAINWVFLGSPLNLPQIAGAILLLVSVTLMAHRTSGIREGASRAG